MEGKGGSFRIWFRAGKGLARLAEWPVRYIKNVLSCESCKDSASVKKMILDDWIFNFEGRRCAILGILDTSNGALHLSSKEGL